MGKTKMIWASCSLVQKHFNQYGNTLPDVEPKPKAKAKAKAKKDEDGADGEPEPDEEPPKKKTKVEGEAVLDLDALLKEARKSAGGGGAKDVD